MTENSFSDHFSERAAEYAARRPTYPEEAAAYLAQVVPRRGVVWEAGCGSGQMTRLLSRYFEQVLATDASNEQLAQAPPLANVEYRRVRAERSSLPADVADLCIAAQAAHWFDLEAYYAEVRRVGRPGAVVALVTYGLMRVNERIDALVRRFYAKELDPHWPPERRLVEDAYASVPFPFDEMEAPELEMYAEWTLPEVLGYVRTWSGVRALLRSEGPDKMHAFAGRLSSAWGKPDERRGIRWPLSMRIGRLPPAG